MNLIHRWLCSSARWKKVVETYIPPWTLEGVNLGSDVLEVGPGPESRGLTERTRGVPRIQRVFPGDKGRPIACLAWSSSPRPLGSHRSPNSQTHILLDTGWHR